MEFISEADFERTGDFPAVEYRLIRSARTVGGEKTAVYSLLCISHDDDGLSDEAFIYDVSSDPETASEIFAAITVGKVTPMTVADVVADCLADL